MGRATKTTRQPRGYRGDMDLLSAMRLYIRVVERGNVSLAARDLGVSQSTISERLARLEEHLNAKLLHRSSRSLSTTDIGAEFYLRSKRVLELASLADETPNAVQSHSLRGTLRIATPSCLGGLILPPILDGFRRQHPDLNCELHFSDGPAAPFVDGADITLQFNTPDAHPPALGTLPRVLVAAPAYLQRHGWPQHPADLSTHGFIMDASDNEPQGLALLGPQGLLTAPVSPAWVVGNWRSVRTLVLNGAGIGIVPEKAVCEALADGRLQRLLGAFPVPARPVYLLHRRSDVSQEKITLAVRHIQADFRTGC